jgi:hypothetical protein
MTRISRLLVGAGAAAMLTVGAASPADAQYYRYRPYRHDNAGSVIAGIAILGGLAAIASATNRDRAYGYGYDRYRSYYTYAVNACGSEAQRIGHGRIRIDEVSRVGGDLYRVTGSVDGDRYGYGRYDRYYGGGENRFTCTAFGNGRIEDFRFRGF